MTQPVSIAVVGHTNTGKTSLLRTLARDSSFGEVDDRPAVTRHVEALYLRANSTDVARVLDTPGLEDSIALLDALESLRRDRSRERIDVIRDFLTTKASRERFTQESKVLQAVLDSDVSLYVIDVRQRMLAKHRDELEVLSWCAVPVVPVLNFVAQFADQHSEQIATWREQLSRVGFHATAAFDTVVLDLQGERRLFETMQTLLPEHRHALQSLINDRRRRHDQLIRSSSLEIADMLVDAAAYTELADRKDAASTSRVVESFRGKVRAREHSCVESLLQLHDFRADEYAARPLPIDDGRWKADPFSPESLRDFGIKTTSAAAAGAAGGLVVDAMFGGLTFGAAAAIGAAIGGSLQAARTHGPGVLNRLRGKVPVQCNDQTLALLAIRQMSLTGALLQRGHAATQPVELDSADQAKAAAPPHEFLRTLHRHLFKARIRPTWSRLNDDADDIGSAKREETMQALADLISAHTAGRPSPDT